jgi:hypothetical protein
MVPRQVISPMPTFQSACRGTMTARVVARIDSQPNPKSNVLLFATRVVTALFATRAATTLFATRAVELPGAIGLLVLLYSEILHLDHLLVTPLSPPILPYLPSCGLTRLYCGMFRVRQRIAV